MAGVDDLAALGRRVMLRPSDIAKFKISAFLTFFDEFPTGGVELVLEFLDLLGTSLVFSSVIINQRVEFLILIFVRSYAQTHPISEDTTIVPSVRVRLGYGHVLLGSA